MGDIVVKDKLVRKSLVVMCFFMCALFLFLGTRTYEQHGIISAVLESLIISVIPTYILISLHRDKEGKNDF